MKIYPEGHKGNYKLNLKKEPAYLTTGNFKCPICGTEFKGIKVRDVKLSLEKATELRKYYKDFEPLYYEVTTCPDCRYSAQTPLFDKLMASRKKMMAEKLEPLLPFLSPWTEELTSGDIFERFYLALMCYETCFPDKELLMAGIWLKLSNLYFDAEDEAMEAYAAGEAQKAYILAFQKCHISPMKESSLNLRIGLLSIKNGDAKTARDFLYKVKINSNSSKLQKDAADDAIEELKAQGKLEE
jgi:uncharacterized protein (DUF2225 family)